MKNALGMMMPGRKLGSLQLQQRLLRQGEAQMQLSYGLLQSGLLLRFQLHQACCRRSWWITTWLRN
jgi:hypothetical protein